MICLLRIQAYVQVQNFHNRVEPVHTILSPETVLKSSSRIFVLKKTGTYIHDNTIRTVEFVLKYELE